MYETLLHTKPNYRENMITPLYHVWQYFITFWSYKENKVPFIYNLYNIHTIFTHNVHILPHKILPTTFLYPLSSLVLSHQNPMGSL